jgi:hypothetical protein
MLVGTNGRAVEHHFCQIPVDAEGLEHAIPDARLGPPREACICRVPIPSAGGKSRPGAPLRAIHNRASTNRRLSVAVTLRSDALPGNQSLIRSHWSF